MTPEILEHLRLLIAAVRSKDWLEAGKHAAWLVYTGLSLWRPEPPLIGDGPSLSSVTDEELASQLEGSFTSQAKEVDTVAFPWPIVLPILFELLRRLFSKV